MFLNSYKMNELYKRLVEAEGAARFYEKPSVVYLTNLHEGEKSDL